MVKSAASGSEMVVSKASKRVLAGFLNVLADGLPFRALTGSYKQCLMFTNQSITLKGSHSA
jgi:hypothetical protein